MSEVRVPSASNQLLDVRCGACEAPVERWVVPWVGRCRDCGSWRSVLEPEIESEQLQELIDTEARYTGLKELREANNRRILDEIAKIRPVAEAKVLDVGSAHGWFLQSASERGAAVEGVEPERGLALESRAAGHTVRVGYFPDVLEADERFDVITFNDVLEHVPDADAAVAACYQHLRPGGVLSVNIPSATGLGYRAARGLARIGLLGPFKRFWQHGLPSPHMHYFQPSALTQMIERHGLQTRLVAPLTAIEREGLWARIHMERRPSPVTVIGFVGLWLGIPILNLPRNSDIMLVLAQRPEVEAA